MPATNQTFFAPQLFIRKGVTDISFYEKAFGAIEVMNWKNDDDSYHVAELSINGALFHLHEEKPGAGEFSPENINGTTTLVGLFVEDVDAVMDSAIAAGATLISPAQSYDYDYRQGQVKDPFGHYWLIEKKI